jgi:hypothetical protein
MPNPASSNHCLRYWDLADHIRIDDAIALWCGVEPAELAKLNFETQCMSAKRAALVAALRGGRLEYEDLGIVTAQGKVFKGAPVDELLTKDRLVIDKASLRRWFEQLPMDDRPPFLFDEERQPVLPDGSSVAETASDRALALMSMLLAQSAGKYRIGERPNSDAIGKAVVEAANPDDARQRPRTPRSAQEDRPGLEREDSGRYGAGKYAHGRDSRHRIVRQSRARTGVARETKKAGASPALE